MSIGSVCSAFSVDLSWVPCIFSIQFATLSCHWKNWTIYCPNLLKISDTLVQPVNKEMVIATELFEFFILVSIHWVERTSPIDIAPVLLWFQIFVNLTYVPSFINWKLIGCLGRFNKIHIVVVWLADLQVSARLIIHVWLNRLSLDLLALHNLLRPFTIDRFREILSAWK